MKREEACKYKTFYDTEFEADLAIARTEYKFRKDMLSYKCGSHWHIANKDKRERNKHIRPIERHDYCDACHQSMRPGRWKTHITKLSHQRNVRKEKASEREAEA